MIDLHCHILPAFDDGAATLEDALMMAEVAAQDGITQLVASPHLRDDEGYARARLIPEAVTQLNGEIRQRGISLEVLAGAEVHIREDLAQHWEAGELVTIGNRGKYLLVEPPFQNLPMCTAQVVFEFVARGVIPIIAHPERVLELQHDPNILVELIERGALSHITGSSLIGALGPGAQRTAEVMLRHGLAHFIATDAHSWKARPPVMGRAVEAAKKLLGEEKAQALVEEHPARVLRGESVPSSPRRVESRKSLWQSLWGRKRGS